MVEIIAEIANAHQGNVFTALKLAKGAPSIFCFVVFDSCTLLVDAAVGDDISGIFARDDLSPHVFGTCCQSESTVLVRCPLKLAW